MLVKEKIIATFNHTYNFYCPEAYDNRAKPSHSRRSSRKKESQVLVAEEYIRTLHDEVIQVYTDGTFKDGKTGAAAVFRNRGKYFLTIGAKIPRATNNIGEIYAIAIAVRRLVQEKVRRTTTCFFIDSEYCIGLFTQGWIPKKNAKLVELVKKLLNKFTKADNITRVMWTPSHRGIEGNEVVDKAADFFREGSFEVDMSTLDSEDSIVYDTKD